MMGKVLDQNDAAYRELAGAKWQVFQGGDLRRKKIRTTDER
jgi:hypothetical protein